MADDKLDMPIPEPDGDFTPPPNPRNVAGSGVNVNAAVASSEAIAYQRRRRNDEVARSGAAVPLPGGVMAPLEDFHGINTLPTADHRRYLAEPEKYIVAHPTPGSRYAWAARDEKYNGDLTSGAVRSGRYIPVKKSQVKDDVDFDLHFKTGTGTNQYVCWRDCMLVEIPAAYAALQYDAPVRDYIRHLGVQQDQFKAGVEQQSRGLAVGKASQRLDPE